jgi:hypothetical protein
MKIKTHVDEIELRVSIDELQMIRTGLSWTISESVYPTKEEERLMNLIDNYFDSDESE